MKLDTSQVEMIKNVKKYFLKIKNFDCDIFYFATTVNSIGLLSLYKIINFKINFFLTLKIILKDFLYGSYYYYAKIYHNENFKKYNNIIVTWAYDYQFNKQGFFFDRTLGINSNKSPNSLWFVIYLSDKLPKKIQDNIVIFKTRDKNKKNFLKLFKHLIVSVKYLMYGKFYFLNSISSFSVFAKIISFYFKDFLNKDVKFLLIPYEGQPFQNKIFKLSKENFPSIKTIGYVHSSPPSIPFSLIKKKTPPDKLILSGKDQFKCFIKYLGWKKNELKVLPSKRFIKKQTNMKNSFYLPLNFRSHKNICKCIKELIKITKLDTSKFKIKNHPGAKNSFSHQKLIEEIKKIKKKNRKLTNNKNNYSVFIGSSGAIVEALERGCKVYQICENDLLERYSSKIWNNIICKKITDKIYFYSLKKKRRIIILGNKSNNLYNYLKV